MPGEGGKLPFKWENGDFKLMFLVCVKTSVIKLFKSCFKVAIKVD